MQAITIFQKCADIQRDIFYKQFMSANKLGEMTCVNSIDNEDSFIFERFEVNGVGFIVAFRLASEDTCISEGIHYEEQPVANLVELKNNEGKERYAEFMKKLEKENKTLQQVAEEVAAQGGDPNSVDFHEFTRDTLESQLQPGRRRINGDRRSRIHIMYRQQEVPSDLQKPAVELFELGMPEPILDYLAMLLGDERDRWEDEHLVPTLNGVDLGCHLPFLAHVTTIVPIVYRFPQREVDMMRAANMH